MTIPSPTSSPHEPTVTRKRGTASGPGRTKTSTSTRQTRQATTTLTTATTPGTTILTKDDVHNATNGRRYLEKRLLLCPAGEPVTTASLATCLHQISEMGGITNVIGNAIRAAAYLAEEIEENAISSVIRDAVLTQVNELAMDMKALVDDAKTKIDDHAKLRKDELDRPSTPSKSHRHELGTSPSARTTILRRHPYQPPVTRRSQAGSKRRN